MTIKQAKETIARLDTIMRRGVRTDSQEFQDWTVAQSELAWHEEVAIMADEYSIDNC